MQRTALVINSIGTLITSRELSKRKELKEKLAQILECVKKLSDVPGAFFIGTIEDLFDIKSAAVSITTLDLLGILVKMITYQFITPETISQVVTLISSSLPPDVSEEKVLVQAFRVLHSSICSGSLHDSVLLVAVRSAYNMFLLSRRSHGQSVSQSILSQMILLIFGRIMIPETSGLEQDNSPTQISRLIISEIVESVTDRGGAHFSLRDGFLIFRALCRLSLKPLPEFTSVDRGTYNLSMKSKILSLELLRIIVRDHISIISSDVPIPGIGRGFIDPDESLGMEADQETVSYATFTFAVKQYLFTSLSRNLKSLVPEVTERAMDIFKHLMLGMRVKLKNEIKTLFLDVFFDILESNSLVSLAYHQKLALLKVLVEILSFPELIVELYVNYDCDAESLDVFERLISSISRILSSIDLKLLQNCPPLPSGDNIDIRGFKLSSPVFKKSLFSDILKNIPIENTLFFRYESEEEFDSMKTSSVKWQALLCILAFLRSLIIWEDLRSFLVSENQKESILSKPMEVISSVDDENSKFENAKSLKATITEGIKLFNWKCERGIRFLVDNSIIENNPDSISRFLLDTSGLSKKSVGEYLGGGDSFNISVMHAFVEKVEFRNQDFVSSLRKFLRLFRLPGEAQKIDRFMLKFAERFVIENPGTFKNADAAYILAYSVVMLNTDLHNPQVKNRMSKSDFVKNNRGINEGNDLPVEILNQIYEDIRENEIRLEEDTAEKNSVMQGGGGIAAFFRRDNLYQLSDEITKLSEKNLRDLPTTEKTVLQNPYFLANPSFRCKSMFEVVWMSILAGISSSMAEVAVDDGRVLPELLYCFKASIHLACIFNIETAKIAFLTMITKNISINSTIDLINKPKNVEAFKALLETVKLDGNMLGDSWVQVFRCISGFELIINQARDSGDVDAGGFIPGVAIGIQSPIRIINSRMATSLPAMKSPISSTDKEIDIRQDSVIQGHAQTLLVGLDHIFSSSVKLSNNAITEFVSALCAVSMEEVQQISSTSLMNSAPRMYSLTKLIEISYYNMGRIRLEWLNIWSVLGEHFNKVGCHENRNVAIFCADSLRQLAMKFLEKEELANFRFQKEFLKPFDCMLHFNKNNEIKDMVIRCLYQIILTKGKNIRSGWKTIFSTLSHAGTCNCESVVLMAFDLVKHVHDFCFEDVMCIQSYFSDYINCLVEFARNTLFVKIGLQTVALIRDAVVKVADFLMKTDHAKYDFDGISEKTADPLLHFMFPVHFGLYEIIMASELEVRSRSLNLLFDILKTYKDRFDAEFWDVISRGVLFPIFDDLRLTKSEKRSAENKEEMIEWLNTTLIQAFRQLIDLFSFSFDKLESIMFDGVVELISVCFQPKQDNETLAKIGSSCLIQLIDSIGIKLNASHWQKLIKMLECIFKDTTAVDLVDPKFIADVIEKSNSRNSAKNGDTILETSDESSESINANMSHNKRLSKQLKRDFKNIIVQCVLQLVVLQTVDEIFIERFGKLGHISSTNILRIFELCFRSFEIARTFNSNYEFRVALYQNGFMNQLPNLLKQETLGVSCALSLLFKIFKSMSETNVPERTEKTLIGIENRIVEISAPLLKDFVGVLHNEGVSSWNQVIVSILNGLLSLGPIEFDTIFSRLSALVVNIILKPNLPDEVRGCLHGVIARKINEAQNSQ